MKTWWNTKAWPWLQRNWQWILLPIGLLMVVGKAFGGRRVTVVGSELTGAAEVAHKAEEKAAKQLVEATQTRDEALAEAKRSHAVELNEVVQDQKDAAPELMANPDALNAHLKGVGKKVRK